MTYLIPVVDGLAYGLMLFVVAAGLSLAFGAAGVLNLAHGTLFAIGAYTAATLTNGTWTSLALAVAVGTAAAAAAGGLRTVGLVPLAARGHLAQALYTFGVALAAGAVLVLAFGPDELRPTVPEMLDQPVHLLGRRYPGYRLAFIATATILAITGWVVLTRTRWGARVRAMRDDPTMLACCGTSPTLMLTAVMTTAGGLAGLAGTLGAPIVGVGPATGEWVLLLSLIVVILGGLDNIAGTFAAAIVVGQVQSLGVLLLPSLAPFLLFTAMAVVLLLRRRPLATVGGPR